MRITTRRAAAALQNLYYIMIKLLGIAHIDTIQIILCTLLNIHRSVAALSMMGDPYATSAFLDSSCFSILYPVYHNPDFMIPQQSAQAYPPRIQQHNAPSPFYRVGPTVQRDILSNAIGIPLTPRLPVSFPTVAPVPVVKDREEPSINSSFISRIYSAQIPNQSFPADRLPKALERELKVLQADDYFVNSLFPESLLPSGMNDEKIIAALSKSTGDMPPIWDEKELRFLVAPLAESNLTDWLNSIGNALELAFGHQLLRLWTYRSCDTPPVGASSTVQRKPDLILLDKTYHKEMEKQNSNIQTDWAFIRAIAETTRSETMSKRSIDSINAKAYLMFLCQYNRRFVVALSFCNDQKMTFTLTVTDREGQIRWTVCLVERRRKERSKLFLRILVVLMFGKPADIGLDPNIEIDHNGKCVAITVEQNRFEVLDLIYSLNSIVGRGTRIWIVTRNGVNYTLKDSWIQHDRVHSEVLMLQKMNKDEELTGRVPTLFCGGDVIINGGTDSTERYRTDLPGWSSKGRRIHRQLVCTPIGESLCKYRSKQELIKSIISIILSTSLCSQRVW